ncbi:MAG: hypothetical protein LKE41_03545 [Prevotella sp.]|nr:hypothetical protein [Prevotella sp.]
METLYMTWVNLLRMQFIEILEFYDENPDRFQYKELKKAYDALLSVKSVEEFKQWRKLLKDYGLSFTDMDGTAHKDNQLGILDDYAEGANDKILDVFIRWKLSFNPLKWMEMENWNRELVDILLKATQRDEDVHIVIFPCGKPNAKRWAAIGQDADRLFEVFGWQTGHVEATTGPVSWMFINGYGLDVLRQSGYSVQIRDFGEFDILSTAFEEDSIASLQQFIDYLRMIGEMADEQVRFLRKIRPVIYPHPGYFELTQARLDFGRNTVVAKFDSGEEVTLAEGKNWNLNGLTRSLAVQMGAELGEA